MYLVFLSMSDEYTKPVAVWEWMCKSADQGYEKAQFEVACWYHTINRELAQPDRQTWLIERQVTCRSHKTEAVGLTALTMTNNRETDSPNNMDLTSISPTLSLLASI